MSLIIKFFKLFQIEVLQLFISMILFGHLLKLVSYLQNVYNADDSRLLFNAVFSTGVSQSRVSLPPTSLKTCHKQNITETLSHYYLIFNQIYQSKDLYQSLQAFSIIKGTVCNTIYVVFVNGSLSQCNSISLSNQYAERP